MGSEGGVRDEGRGARSDETEDRGEQGTPVPCSRRLSPEGAAGTSSGRKSSLPRPSPLTPNPSLQAGAGSGRPLLRFVLSNSIPHCLRRLPFDWHVLLGVSSLSCAEGSTRRKPCEPRPIPTSLYDAVRACVKEIMHNTSGSRNEARFRSHGTGAAFAVAARTTKSTTDLGGVGVDPHPRWSEGDERAKESPGDRWRSRWTSTNSHVS